jgi:hypothetical protein
MMRNTFLTRSSRREEALISLLEIVSLVTSAATKSRDNETNNRRTISAMRPLALVALLVLSSAASSFAQLPIARLSTVFPPGGKIGTSVEVRLSGLDLDDVTQLHFSHAGITAKQKVMEGASRPEANKFVVTIAPNVTPGVFEARAIGRFGISNPRAFVIGDLAESTEKEPNDSLSSAVEAQLGSVINGNAESNTADHFKFKAKKGQRILIECLAKEIDSRMDAVLVLYDSAGHELGRNRRGSLLDFTTPADGEFIVKTYDFLYRGGDDYFYRLSIGTGPHIDFILPPSGLPGTKEKYVLFGRNLPGGAPAPDFVIDGKPLEQLSVESEMPKDPAARQKLSSSSLTKPRCSMVSNTVWPRLRECRILCSLVSPRRPWCWRLGRMASLLRRRR